MQGKRKLSFIFYFKLINILVLISYFKNILINASTSTEASFSEPVETLMKNGFRHLDVCVAEPCYNSSKNIYTIYVGVFTVNDKDINVYACVVPKTYTKTKEKFKFLSSNDCLDIIIVTYKEDLFNNIKSIQHKNIKPILKVFESENFHYYVQEMPSDKEKFINLETLKQLTSWQAQKLILSYCYGIKALNDNNIMRKYYDVQGMVIDENFNIRFNQLLNILNSYKSIVGSLNMINLHENTCLDLYDFSEVSKETFEKIKLHSEFEEIWCLTMFCSEVLYKTLSKSKSKSKKQEIPISFQIYGDLQGIKELDSKNWIERIINNEVFKYNIVSIMDFRKFTDEIGETPNYTFVKEENKLYVYSRGNDDLKIAYEFNYIESTHPILFNNGKIHYRDFEVRKNGKIIDFDELSEEEFLTYKKEIENLVLEVEMYNCKNAKFRMSNDILDVFLFETPERYYSSIYKSNFSDKAHFLFLKVVDNEVKFEGLEVPLKQENFDEYSARIKEFTENIDFLFNDEEYRKWKGISTDSNEEFQDCLFQLTYFYIPGLGYRREIDEDKFIQVESKNLQLLYGDVVYELTRCNVKIIFRDNEFYEVKINDKDSIELIKLSKEDARREEIMKEIDYLLGGSLIKIKKF